MISPTPPTTALLTWCDRHRRWLWTGIALLLLAGFNGQWRIGPDSSVHVSVGRNLIEGAGYTHPTGLESAVRPGLAWVTAATFYVVGADNFAVINLVMLLCAAGTLAASYWVVRLAFDRPTAVVVVAMLAVNETFYRYGYQVLTDMPFLLALMGGLLGLELCRRGTQERWLGIALVVLAVLLMAAFRTVVVTVLIAGLAAGVHRTITGPRRLLSGGLTSIATVACAAAGWFTGGGAMLRDSDKAMDLAASSFGETAGRVLTVNGPELLTENIPEALFGVDTGPWAGAPLSVTAVALGVVLIRIRPFWGLLVLVFLAQWLLLITTDRYLLTLMPLLALAWWRGVRWIEGRPRPPVSHWLAVGLLVVWFVPNLVMTGRFIVEQRARPFLASYESGRYRALRSVAHELAAVAVPGDVLIADDAPQLTYFTRLPVYGPATLPMFGPKRDQTVTRVQEARRVLMISPAGDILNDRIAQLKLRRDEVVAVVPTPEYDRVSEYEIVRLWTRDVDWENYRRRRERLRQRALATEEGEGEPEEQAGEPEQGGDQPR